MKLMLNDNAEEDSPRGESPSAASPPAEAKNHLVSADKRD